MLRLAVLLALIPTGSAAAQEAPLPPDAVARVGAETVSRGDFDTWYRAATRSARVDPPRFERCIAALTKRPSERRSRPSRADLRRRCERRAKRLHDEVMQFLLEAAWVRQEAAARDIVVTLPQIVRAFEDQKRQAFESEGEYQRFLRQSGLTEAQLLHRVGLDLLLDRIKRQVTDAAAPVTADDVRRYYANHRRAWRGIPRAKALRRIERLLNARRQMRAIDRFTRRFRARYRAITVCADGYVVAECGQRA